MDCLSLFLKFASHVILNELLDLSVPQILYLKNRYDNNDSYFVRLFYGLNERICVKTLEILNRS